MKKDLASGGTYEEKMDIFDSSLVDAGKLRAHAQFDGFAGAKRGASACSPYRSNSFANNKPRYPYAHV